MIKGMLDNLLQIEIMCIEILHIWILHIEFLHLGILHMEILLITIAIVCHTLHLKMVIEIIPHSNTKGMFRILEKHLILG